jgi:DNA-directed RNA polymerase subunit RPC12/RpoP
MKIIQFLKKFPNELSCKKHFKLYRDNEGVICKKCENTTHYWLSTLYKYKCKKCGFRTTLRSGTIMENSHLIYFLWNFFQITNGMLFIIRKNIILIRMIFFY